MIRVSATSTSGHRSGTLVELPSMTSLHVEPSDPPEKRQHGMWKVFLFYDVWNVCSSLCSFRLLLLDDQNMSIYTGKGVS